MDFFVRITSLVKKELLAVLRDKKSRMALIIPPIIQICIFGYAATMNVTRVPYAVLDKDGGESAAQYIADLEGTGIFRRQAAASTEKDIDRMIDNRKIVIGLTIPPDFSRNLQTGRPASLQLIADGRNANTAAIALGYAQQIASAFGADLAARNGGASPVEIETRSWFNPNLITRWFIVPGLIAVLALINSILSGALSIAREREEGTFDQLLVAPYNPGEILLGKGIATVITGSMQAVFVVLVAMFWFRIPFQGSIWLLATAILLFIITATAIGLCISSFAQSLQQAIVGTFLLLVPMVMLSGFATPISSMPDIFQDLTLLNPMRYGLELIQRIFLEGAGFLDLWPLFGAILIVTAVSVFAAIFSFHHKISRREPRLFLPPIPECAPRPDNSAVQPFAFRPTFPSNFVTRIKTLASGPFFIFYLSRSDWNMGSSFNG